MCGKGDSMASVRSKAKSWWEDEKYASYQKKEKEEELAREQKNWDRTRAEELEDQGHTERREDLQAKREMWGGVVIAMLQETHAVSAAVEAADKVLDEYQKRFGE